MTLLQHTAIVVLLGGVALFMYGMTLASDALQKLLANKLRQLLAKMSDKNILTIGIGVALTVCVQSSGAVTSMLVGLGTAGVITLPQVMGIILGTAVGTTMTVQLISFNISQYGLGIFIASYMIFFLTQNRKAKNILSVFMGFGLIFFGIELMGMATKEIQNLPFMAKAFVYLTQYPFVAFAVSTIFTGFVHSSAVTIGFAMSLASHGMISMLDAMYWVFGANVGTTSTALMAAVGSNYVGRQVAWAHFFYKVASVALFMLFIGPFSDVMEGLSGGAARDIANAHTLFNILAALLFYPFIQAGSRMIEKMFPPREEEKEFSARFIKEETYHSTAIALAHARREILRMGDIVISMIKESIHLFKDVDPELVADISKRDTRVDLLHRELKLFLLKHANQTKEGVSKEVFDLISFANDMESAADVIDHNILDLARKKQALKLEFSPDGWREMQRMHELTVQACALSLTAFQTQEASLAQEVIDLKRAIRKVEKDLKESHIGRLNLGLRESINTSSIHLDLLGDFRRIVGIMSNHAYSVSKKKTLDA